ncbi:RNA polymerase sigma factor [Candidatus Uabimicrobium sp. HlEnr_7]|uniref:RNA polymerase sigma factor n=1 Tax=Candidatus Uabimicrobium helgolandensis TaxID=3095367 RepID=UPI003556D8FC
MNDTQLILQFKQGNTRVFNAIVERHKKRIYFFALKLSQDHQKAEDISQETFLRAYNKLHTLKEESSFVPWLYRIASNYYRSIIRRPMLKVVSDVDLNSLAIDRQEEDDNEMEKAMKCAIAQLPKKQKVALVLRCFEGLSYKEISQIMGISNSAAKAHVSYARNKLRDLMERTNDEM